MASREPISKPLREVAGQTDSIRRLAREAGLNHGTVTRFIAGRRVRSDHLDRLAAVLGYELKPVKRR